MKSFLFINWNNDSDNIGLKLIDEQHRGIVSIINTLYYFMQSGVGEDELLNILDMLEKYLKVHFIVEEDMMKEAKYKDLKIHILQHEAFMKLVQNMKRDIKTTNEPIELLKSLKKWWFLHIKNEDTKYKIVVKESLDI